MTTTDHLAWLIAIAFAITAILTIGTLVAADILHLGRRGPTPEAKSPEPAEELTEAFAPLGASLTAASQLQSPTATTTRPEDLATSSSRGRSHAYR